MPDRRLYASVVPTSSRSISRWSTDNDKRPEARQQSLHEDECRWRNEPRTCHCLRVVSFVELQPGWLAGHYGWLLL